MPEINIVLVGTLYSQNIGSCARALGNMGGHRLILVNPQCEIDSRTKQGAAGAQDYLNKITTYTSWQNFYENEGQGVRIALTRRHGKQRKTLALQEVVSTELESIKNENVIYLIFGPEDNGLSAEDMAYVNFAAHLPAYGKFKSMNLSHAVLLALYVVQVSVRQRIKSENPRKPARLSAPKEKVQPLVFPDQSLKDWLTAMGFDLSARRASAYTTLRRVILRNCPSRNDLMVLEAILRQNIRKLRDRDTKSH